MTIYLKKVYFYTCKFLACRGGHDIVATSLLDGLRMDLIDSAVKISIPTSWSYELTRSIEEAKTKGYFELATKMNTLLNEIQNKYSANDNFYANDLTLIENLDDLNTFLTNETQQLGPGLHQSDGTGLQHLNNEFDSNISLISQHVTHDDYQTFFKNLANINEDSSIFFFLN